MRTLDISYGASRFSTTWSNQHTTWRELAERLSTTTVTPETAEQFRKMRKPQQDEIKDIGGFVGGHLRDGRRKKGHALSRDLITLDLDHGQPLDVWNGLKMFHSYAALAYSTHKHTPAAPRLRLVIPTSRPLTEEEYPAVARMVAYQLDPSLEAFDDTTYEPTRLMYWPSTPTDVDYFFDHQDGPFLDVDTVLAQYKDWRDVTTWPVSTRQTNLVASNAAKQADPLSKPGVVGAFCRAYSIHEAIRLFLEGVYAPSVHDGRYDYLPGESSAGVVTYDDKYSYSHHATDPTSGKLVNAFDLVRIHRYGHLDEDTADGTPTNRTPSYQAMTDYALSDLRVRRRLVEEKLTEAKAEFTIEPGQDDWTTRLDLAKNGDLKDTLNNHVLIISHDPKLAGIAFNEHRDGIDIRDTTGLPWRPLKPGWTDQDNAALRVYIQKTYGLYSPTKMKDALLAAASARVYNPVKEYLEALPTWDGVPRVDRLLPVFFGADDTPYTRAVTRKTLLAAYQRVYKPGIKFDTVLILNGPQGSGKSTFFNRLGRDWFSDALTLTDMKDKASAEKLQGNWILELGELAGMRKTDVETVKSFITRTDDKYRPAYGTTVESHPRRSIIVGTTNAESGFLRDVTGNRRFWPVTVPGTGERKPWDMTENDVDQIWAEIKHLAARDEAEPLYLTGEAANQARQAQQSALETDEREGLVAEYLDQALPDDWYYRSLYERRQYLATANDFAQAADTGNYRAVVTSIEIWAECFGQNPNEMRAQDSYQISAIMQKLPGWCRPDKGSGRKRFPIYGMQRFWVREGEEDHV